MQKQLLDLSPGDTKHFDTFNAASVAAERELVFGPFYRGGVNASRTGDGAGQGDTDDALQSKPRAVVTGVAAELRDFAKLRDEGILTDEEYTEQKNRLLGR